MRTYWKHHRTEYGSCVWINSWLHWSCEWGTSIEPSSQVSLLACSHSPDSPLCFWSTLPIYINIQILLLHLSHFVKCMRYLVLFLNGSLSIHWRSIFFETSKSRLCLLFHRSVFRRSDIVCEEVRVLFNLPVDQVDFFVESELLEQVSELAFTLLEVFVSDRIEIVVFEDFVFIDCEK